MGEQATGKARRPPGDTRNGYPVFHKQSNDEKGRVQFVILLLPQSGGTPSATKKAPQDPLAFHMVSEAGLEPARP